MIPVSRVSQVQRLDACLALLPPKPLRVRVTYFGSCVFFRVSIKRVCEKKTQVVVGLSTSSRRIYVL